MAVTVLITKSAQKEFSKLPAFAQAQVTAKLAALALWPAVTGVKALQGALRGTYRVRTGNYRIQFTVSGDDLTVVSVDDRKDSY